MSSLGGQEVLGGFAGIGLVLVAINQQLADLLAGQPDIGEILATFGASSGIQEAAPTTAGEDG